MLQNTGGDNLSKFSDRLVLLIKQAGMTQARFAADLGITPQAASCYVNGREPSFDLLIKISEYFHVTTDYLLGASENERISIGSYGDVVNALLAMEQQGVLSHSVEEIVKDIHTVSFSIPQYECGEFFAEYSRMVKLYIDGSITANAFGTWLGAELAKLQKISLPHQLIWKDGEWVVKNEGRAN